MLPWLIDIPRVVISALTGSHLHRLPEHWVKLYEESRRQIATPVLNKWLEEVQVERQAPSTRLGRPARIYYASQSGTRPPRPS